MKKISRFLSLLLTAVLLLGLLPGQVLAEQWQSSGQTVELPLTVNPRYSDIYTPEDIAALWQEPESPELRPQATKAMELEDAAEVLREGMVARQSRITVSFYSDDSSYQGASDELFELAMAHTGDPREGDSIMWQYAGWGGSMGRSKEGGRYLYTADYDIYYYTTAEQEKELDKAVEELLTSLNLEDKSDYTKIADVYMYICDNITYDYDNLEDTSYMLKHTAYAALINKTAVCQGYALLFYRLMLELGVDSRIIVSSNHAWNIVELDGLYYNLDSTWDAGNYSFYWFLKSFWGFGNHERTMEYDTIAFHNEYPMSAKDHRDYYVYGIEPYMDPYINAGYADLDSNIIWYIHRDGYILFDGTGPCYDYPEDQWPYFGYWKDELTGVWVNEGVTHLGNYSFYLFPEIQWVALGNTVESLGDGCFADCPALTQIEFAGNAPEIAADAFRNVTATVYYPANDATWTADKLQSYGGNLTWKPVYPECQEHTYEAVVTAPTCTDQGYTTYTCTACGSSYVADYVDALGHDMGEWTAVTAPTCTESGTEQRSCTRCAHAEERTTDPAGHSHESVVTAPTCTEQGFTTYTCHCGDSYAADFVDALGHDWDAGVVIVEPTEDTQGQMRYTCLRCAGESIVPIPELGHTHSHESVVTAPTCTGQGYTTYTCACGDSYVADYVEALGHDLSDWQTVAEPTCTESGTEQRTCSRCAHTEERSIDPAGHSHESVVTAPTCTDQGYTTYTCHCGDSYVADYTDALGHDYTDGICTRCGEADPDYEEPAENPFTDVSEGQFYYAPVLWAVENGITSGTSATTFDPNGQCMRAHVVTFLWRAAGSPEPTSTVNPFVDVKETDFYYKAVLWAVEKGITNGVDATHFGPFTYCNRAQVVTFLHRAMGKPAPAADNCPFTDVEAGAWYAAPILWAVENGITNGMSADTFGVSTICNRAQVVTFLYRTYVN